MDYAHHRADGKRILQGVCGANDHALLLPTSQGVMHSVRGMCISFIGGYNDVFYDVRCYNRHVAMFF